MKTKFSLLSILVCMLVSFKALSQQFVVCSGESFTLTISNVAAQNYIDYEWYLDNGTTPVHTQSTYTPTVTLTTATTAEKLVYRVRGRSATCWSDYEEITVYVLPVPTVTIADTTTYCSNNFSDATLAATSNYASLNFSALGSVTPTFTSFVWSTTGGAGSASGSNNETYTATSATGTYTAKVSYDKTASWANGFDGIKLNCEGSADHVITVNTAPDAPTVTFQ